MKRTLTIIGLLALLIPGALWAQDELTLEGLAENLASMEDRLAGLEAIFANPWSPDVVYTDDGVCHSPLHFTTSSILGGEVRQETADAYRATYGASIAPSDVYLRGISFEVEGDHVYLKYGKGNRVVVEKWAHCEFLGHSDWEDK